ncbi:hypothetical protein C8F01DRAFT_1084229 [Mycena amicta]|nr:hypothetical protein C8F01DRAFT_1084229 [Mycena amicta]
MKEKHGEDNAPARSSIQTPAGIANDTSGESLDLLPEKTRSPERQDRFANSTLRLGARTVHRSETTACAAGYSRQERRQAGLWRLWKTIQMRGNPTRDVHPCATRYAIRASTLRLQGPVLPQPGGADRQAGLSTIHRWCCISAGGSAPSSSRRTATARACRVRPHPLPPCALALVLSQIHPHAMPRRRRRTRRGDVERPQRKCEYRKGYGVAGAPWAAASSRYKGESTATRHWLVLGAQNATGVGQDTEKAQTSSRHPLEIVGEDDGAKTVMVVREMTRRYPASWGAWWRASTEDGDEVDVEPEGTARAGYGADPEATLVCPLPRAIATKIPTGGLSRFGRQRKIGRRNGVRTSTHLSPLVCPGRFGGKRKIGRRRRLCRKRIRWARQRQSYAGRGVERGTQDVRQIQRNEKAGSENELAERRQETHSERSVARLHPMKARTNGRTDVEILEVESGGGASVEDGHDGRTGKRFRGEWLCANEKTRAQTRLALSSVSPLLYRSRRSCTGLFDAKLASSVFPLRCPPLSSRSATARNLCASLAANHPYRLHLPRRTRFDSAFLHLPPSSARNSYRLCRESFPGLPLPRALGANGAEQTPAQI